jgi:hypothetical protein
MSTVDPINWVVHESDEGISFRWGYLDGDIIAEWEGLMTLHATRSGDLKSLQTSPGISPQHVEKVRNGIATAFLRAQRKQHSLHASAVAWEGQALVCVGESGLGKSTTAYRMCRQLGFELLADDITGIELVPAFGAQVVPTEAVVWLINDPCGDKAPAPVPRVAHEPVSLRLIVCLAWGEASSGVELRDLRGGDTVSKLLPALIRFEKSAQQWTRELDFLDRIVSQCRVVQLVRSRDATADAVADALLGLMRQEPR